MESIFTKIYLTINMGERNIEYNESYIRVQGDKEE